MKITDNNIFLVIGILLFMIIKMVYSFLSTEELVFIIGPTNFLVSILLGTKGTYLQGVGYFHQDLNITIEKACSGFNFLILSFITSYYLAINHLKNKFPTWLIITISIFLSWILTLFVNTSRIVSSIILHKSFFFGSAYGDFLHQIEGTFIYLFFLILFYKTLNYIFKKYAENEKFA